MEEQGREGVSWDEVFRGSRAQECASPFRRSMTWQVISVIRSAPGRARFESHGLTGVGFVFNKFVKYGYAFSNLPGPRRPDPPRAAGAARHRRRDRERTRRTLRPVLAGGGAASPGSWP